MAKYKYFLCKHLCKQMNNLFPLPVHPFNLQNEGEKTYADWQFEKGKETIQYYLNQVSENEMFKNKVILDIGCGAAGKTLYYATKGVKKIYGLDIVDKYRDEALSIAKKKNLIDIFEFIVGNASQLPFKENFFDVIILNDAMEHVEEPLSVLNQCYKVLKPGGRVYVNFPPYYHPYGAHLSDAISFPWIHVLFDDKTLITVYKKLVTNLPDGNQRINFRISKNSKGQEYFSYINKMTIKQFKEILHKTKFKMTYYKEIPLRNFFKPLCKLSRTKEYFVKMVVCILEK